MVKFKPDFERRYPLVARIVAIVSLINLGLVLFDVSYLALRQVYGQYVPAIVQLYDPVKGVEVQPETAHYQAEVDRLAALLNPEELNRNELNRNELNPEELNPEELNRDELIQEELNPEELIQEELVQEELIQEKLESAEVAASLAELRTLSDRLLIERPFVSPNGDDALATVQQKLRSRTGESFGQDAFHTFWSADYLMQQGWQAELGFWQTQIEPFFQANYYRQINSWGGAIDYFWLIDLPFVLIFAADILTRIIIMHRRNPELTWLNVILRRWYDGFLLLPFLRWLRVIPVSLRLYQADLLDLEPVRTELERDTIVTVGADLAGIVGIEIIEQLQESLRSGSLPDLLSAAPSHGDDLTDSDAPQEVLAITDQLYDASVQHILPRIQPDIEDLVKHSLTRTLEQMTGQHSLHQLPGLGQVSSRLVQQLSSAVVQGAYQSLAGSLSDAEGKEITDRLQHNLREAIAQEFDQHQTFQEIQSRLLNVLDEFKSKYVRALSEAGGEVLADRIEELHRQIS